MIINPKRIKGVTRLSLNPVIRFEFICIRRDFQLIRNHSYNHEEMDSFKSLRESMTMLAKLICHVSMMLMPLLIFFFFFCLILVMI
jgi:hypothetical protein